MFRVRRWAAALVVPCAVTGPTAAVATPLPLFLAGEEIVQRLRADATGFALVQQSGLHRERGGELLPTAQPGVAATVTARASAPTPGPWIDYPFPLRSEVLQTLRLPSDLTVEEGERLAGFLRSLGRSGG